MNEEVINKWKDVSPEDITSKPNWEEGWELVHADVVKVHDASEILKDYIGKRFRPKANFIAFIKEKTRIKFSETKSYDALFSEIEKKIGKEKFFSILGIKDLEEAEIRSQLADVFYKALVETTWMHQFSPLYERLTGEKIKIKRKVEKKEPAYRLAFSVDENEFIDAWTDLYKGEVLPPVIPYKNIVIGPLGWLKSLEKREKEMFGLIFGLHSDIIRIIGDKFDPESQDIIIGALLGIIEQIGNDPNKFELQDVIGREALKHLKEVESEQDENIRFAKSVQVIHVYLNDENLISIINELIASKKISGPKIHGLYERYPYSFSDWIITKYGIFKQDPSWKRNPNKKLFELLQKKFKKEDLEPELKHYQGDSPMNLLAYCVKESPKEILDRLIGGIPDLRNIAKRLGIPAAKMIESKDELIKLILLRLGFNIPPTIVGISQYRKLLDEYLSDINKDKPVKGIMRDVYVETENLLRDLSYFYICWYSKSTDVEKINEMVSELNISDKPFQRLTLGEHIKLIRTLNTKIERDHALKKRFSADFGKDRILPKDKMDILDTISAYRKPFIHPDTDETLPDRETCVQIVSDIQNFSDYIEKEGIFPLVIQTKRDVTDEYGISHYEVVDDRDNEWWIHKGNVWLDVPKLYFMHSATKPVAIRPVIIEKIF
ncbi:MAG: hypothetical protein ISS94_01725 [Candidatus Syntrophoarchaeum sp.]|nr:hypothetical protein [Candidatus Syntrophoarchaeum sp.]